MSYRKKTVGFTSNKVGRKKEYTGFASLINRGFVFRAVLFGLLFFGGFYVFSQLFSGGSNLVATISKETVKMVSRGAGNTMTKDALGNINVLITGYAGEQERGGFLTDTIMVASYNPSIGTVTFLSVPRDLYVTYHKGGRGRLNGAYRAKYIDSNNNHEEAAEFLLEKVSEITGIQLQYYTFVSFDGFVDLIDSIGGVTIDVPYELVDPKYPDQNNGYQTFIVREGEQVFDGDTALKYARSRQTTSDFSRTLRQQQIIKSLVNKVIGEMGVTNVTKVKQLYDKVFEMVNTNISIKEILGLVQYAENERRFFSFVYTSDCDKRYFELTMPGCVLVLGNQDDYNGQSVMLPIGATPGNINYYKHTKDFAFWVIHNQEFLLENPQIKILNGIDKDRAKQNQLPIEGVATRLGIELKSQAFNVVDMSNSEEKIQKSIVYVQDKNAYAHTLELLDIFVDVDEVRTDGVGDLGEGITIILGNDYLLD